MTKQNTLCGQWRHCKLNCPHLLAEKEARLRKKANPRSRADILHKESSKGNKGGKNEEKGQSKGKSKGYKGH